MKINFGTPYPLNKGAGEKGPSSSITFIFFLIKKNVSYNKLFRNAKRLFLAKVIVFLDLKNTNNYIASANFNRNSPRINFKIYFQVPSMYAVQMNVPFVLYK